MKKFFTLDTLSKFVLILFFFVPVLVYACHDGCGGSLSCCGNCDGGTPPPPPPPPVPTMYIKNLTTGAAETSASTLTIGPTDEIQLRWTTAYLATLPTSCGVSAVAADTAFSGAVALAATDATVTEPNEGSSRVYRITCGNAYGSNTDTVTVTRTITPPTVALYGNAFSDGVDGSETSGPLSIKSTEEVELRWEATASAAFPPVCTASVTPTISSTYAQSVYTTTGDDQFAYSQGAYSGSGSYAQGSYSYYGGTPANVGSTDWNISGGSPTGSDDTIIEPVTGTSRTYTVSCTNAGGTAVDSIVVSRVRGPVVTMYVKNLTTGDPERSSNISIGASDQIQLRWTSTNSPTSCTASAETSDSAFSTGGATAGTDTTVTEPAVGESRLYKVSCTGIGGTGYTTLKVTNPAEGCVVGGSTVQSGGSATFYSTSSVSNLSLCTSQLRSCDNGVLSGSSLYTHASCSVGSASFGDLTLNAYPTIVRYGEDSEITWDGGGATSCTISGDPFGTISTSGVAVLQNITGERTVELTCTLGTITKSKSVVIKVLPSPRESFNTIIDRFKSQLASVLGLQWL